MFKIVLTITLILCVQYIAFSQTITKHEVKSFIEGEIPDLMEANAYDQVIDCGTNYVNVATDNGVLVDLYTAIGEAQVKQYQLNGAFVSLAEASKIQETFLPKDQFRTATIYEVLSYAHSAKKEYEEAIDYLKEAIDIRRDSLAENHEFLIPLYRQLGHAYNNKRSFAEGLATFQKVYDITLERHGVQAAISLDVLFDIGQTHRKQGTFEKAEEILKLVEQNRQQIFPEDHPDIVTSTIEWGHFYYDKGKYNKAITYYTKSITMLETLTGMWTLELAEVYHALGSAHLKLKQFNQAHDPYQRSVEIIKRVSGSLHPLIASAYNSLGRIYGRGRNEFHITVQYYDEALAIQKELFGEDHIDLASTYSSMGNVNIALGNYQTSVNCYAKAIDLGNKYYHLNPKGLVSSHNNMGVVYEKMHDYEKAIIHYEKAIDISERLYPPNHPALGQQYGVIGFSYNKNGENDKAEAAFQKGLNIFLNAFHEKHHMVGIMQQGLGIVHGEQEEYEEAELYFTKGLEAHLLAFDTFHNQTAIAFYALAELYLKTGRYDETIETYELIIDIFTKIFGEDFHRIIHSYNTISEAYRAKGEYEIAVSYSEKAMNKLDKLRENYTSAATKKTHFSDYYPLFDNAIHNQLALHKGKMDDVILSVIFNYMEKSKSMLLLESFNSLEAKAFGGIPEALLLKEKLLAQGLSSFDKKLFRELQKGKLVNDSLLQIYNDTLYALNQNYEDLVQHFESTYPSYYQLKYDLNVNTLPDVQQSLKNDEAIIEYFTGDSLIYALLITPETCQMEVIDIDFPLVEQVQGLRKGLYGFHLAGLSSKEDYEQYNSLLVENAHKLYNKLIHPFGDLPARLMIIPDGILGYIPFEVLLSELPKDYASFSNHSYLIRDHEISYNFSTTSWQSMKARQHPTKKSLLAFAPSFDDSKAEHSDVIAELRRDLGPLVYNQQEVIAIQQLMGGEVLKGKEATLKSFYQKAEAYNILHFATHAKTEDKVNDFSYLAFADVGDSTMDNKLYIRDLYTLQLPLNMVVLSACETGLGELQKGEGIVSLARGFAYAGAKSLITSLWSANDQATSTLMQGFYKNLKKGNSKDQALRTTKLSYLDSEDTGHYEKHPFYWATFIAVGDMAPLQFGWQGKWFWALSALLLLGFGIYRWSIRK